MNITRFAIEKNRITFAFLLIVILGGLAAYKSISRAKSSSFVIRWATVTTKFSGASPERMELLISDPIEKVVQETPELDFVQSTSLIGYSSLFVRLKDEYTDTQPIWDDLERRLEDIKQDLPQGITGPDLEYDFDEIYGIQVAIMGEGYSYAELKDVADEVRDEILHLPDVAEVLIVSEQKERIYIEYNNARLAELGISPDYILNYAQTRNIVAPGGKINVEGEKIVLEPTGNFQTLDDLRSTLIILPGTKDVVYLQDIFKITRDYEDPPPAIMHFNGQNCLGLAVSMRQGGNMTRLGEQVKALLVELEPLYPIGVEFGTYHFEPDEVERSVNEFVNNILQAILIVMFIMMISLGMRTGLLVSTLIPMVMLMSLLIMNALGIILHEVSLGSLIIALGMLVDNAIVMAESISVQIRSGKKPIDAAIDSATELRIPLLVASLTTCAAFFPIYIADSLVAEYCETLFTVTSIALLSSWFLSMIMTPMLCARYLKPKKKPKKDHFESRFYRLYRGLLVTALHHRLVTIVIVAIIFFSVMSLFPLIPQTFFPPTEEERFFASLEMPLGTPIERTEEVAKQIDAFVAKEMQVNQTRADGITKWATFIGNGPPRTGFGDPGGGGTPQAIFILFQTSSHKDLFRWIKPIEKFCLLNFPDLEVLVDRFGMSAGADVPIEVRLFGKDIDKVFEVADGLKDKLRQIPGTKLIKDSWGPRAKKLLVRINEARARRAGVTNSDVATTLQGALTGQTISEFRENDKVIPIVLRSQARYRENIDKLESLNIYSRASGQPVTLRQVADIEVVWQPSAIFRRDRLKTVSVTCELDPEVTAAEVEAIIEPWLKEQSKNWDRGYKYELGGEAEASDEANSSVAAKMPIAAFIILLLLVGQFNSFRAAFIILTTIPLGLIGVTLGLIIADSYFGFMTLLGVTSLAGIVINNAIVLIDRIKIERATGLDPRQAIIEAGQRRLRPILLTTATTTGGLLPLWFNGQGMWETMAITIIFGLIFSTLFTLVFVPVLYSLLYKIKFKGFRYE
ncbi:MAG: efflux RND transporter permease subunit [Planctomycetes bacterium]|nr:efflux RND transporter permease subunit [Planctomycetota bacterium]